MLRPFIFIFTTCFVDVEALANTVERARDVCVKVFGFVGRCLSLLARLTSEAGLGSKERVEEGSTGRAHGWKDRPRAVRQTEVREHSGKANFFLTLFWFWANFVSTLSQHVVGRAR